MARPGSAAIGLLPAIMTSPMMANTTLSQAGEPFHTAKSTRMNSKAIDTWHEVVRSRSTTTLDALLADHVVFHSPVVHSPQQGKALTRMYLTGAMMVLANDSFRYVREVIGERDAVLEFSAEIDGIQVNGVDLIRWDDNDQIVDFKVMLRPLKAVNLIHQKMATALQGVR